jgi:hypothetical protein
MHHRFTDVESPCTCPGEAIGYALDQDVQGLILCMCGQPNLQAYQCIGCQRPDSMPHALTSAERRGTRYISPWFGVSISPSRGRGGAGCEVGWAKKLRIMRPSRWAKSIKLQHSPMARWKLPKPRSMCLTKKNNKGKKKKKLGRSPSVVLVMPRVRDRQTNAHKTTKDITPSVQYSWYYSLRPKI